MLTVSANDRHRYCDGLTRRSFLQAGLLGAAGLALPDLLRLRAQGSQQRGGNRHGMPAYVAVPVAASVGLVPGYNSGAYLGTSYNPFQTGSDPNSPNFSVNNLRLPNGVTVGQLEDRRTLLTSLDTMRRDV